MLLKIFSVLFIIAVLFLIISDINNLQDEENIKGEILKAHATPDFLIEGQPENFEVTVKNLGTHPNFMIEVRRDSQVVAYYNFNFNDATIKIINLRSILPPVRGKSVYKYTLYPGIIGGTSIPVSSIIESRRIYSRKDLSDEDNDGLRYFEELEIGTDPGNADTDGDGLYDMMDPYPAIGKYLKIES